MTTTYPRLSAIPCLIALCSCSTVDSRPIETRQDEYYTPASIAQTVPTEDSTDDYKPDAPPPASSAATIAANAPASQASTKVRRTMFDPSASTAAQAGVAYFLPRQLATVTVKRTEITLDDAISALGKAELALSVANAMAAAAKTHLEASRDQLIDKGDNPVIRDLLMARIEEQKATVAKAEAAAEQASKERTKKGDALRTGAGSGGDHLYKVAVEIVLMTPTSDPKHGYRLNPRHSAFRDDKHKFDVSAKGLLNSTDIVAADRTADILVELATFAGAATLGRTVAEKMKCTEQSELSAAVDLADRESIEDLNSIIECLGTKLESVGPASVGQEPMNGSARAGARGIFYRTPVDMLIRIRKCIFLKGGVCQSGGDWPIAQIIAVSLPQAGPISYVAQNAGPMTTTHYALAFKDGILTTYDSTRPSELLEVARTPMRMLNGFFDGASKIISIRTGHNNARATMVQSDTALQTAQLNSQSTVSAAGLAASQALLRDQAKRDAINRCIGERVTRGEPYDSCFVGS